MTTPPHRAARVTGAASGIGRATATLLARQGHRVLCLDRDDDANQAAAAAIRAAGGEAIALALDVADEAGWGAADETTRRELGRLDVAVHCAGISTTGPVSGLALADWRAVLAVNLDGVFLGTRAAIRLMRSFGHGGAIINVSSASGLRALAEGAAYCTSKAAVNMLTRCAARECRQAGDGIRVVSVCPGGVKTPIWSTVPFFQELIAKHGSEEAAFAAMTAGTKDRFAEPEEIAHAIAYLAGDAAALVTGTELVIDGGYLA